VALDVKTLICFYFGMVLELEGALRFAMARKPSRLWYWGAVPFLLFQGWLTVGRDEVVLRSLVVAVFMAWVSFRIAWIFLAGEGWSNHLYRLFSILYVLMGAAILVRALLWMTNPSHGLFDAPYFQTACFSLTLVAGTGASLCYLLVTSQRLEQEVRSGEERFRRLVEASTMGIAFLQEEPGDRLTLTGVNPAACSILHAPEDQRIGRPLREAFPGEAAEVSVSVEGDRAKVEVSDRGPGIRQEIQGSLFEPFVRSRTGHTGLGLALARHHLRSHRGDLEGGDSEPGPGAVFAATLPLRPEFCDATEAAEVSRVLSR
jgi:PAS domain-containing protein